MTNYQIHFDETTHTYTVNGEVKRSVTQLLESIGLCSSDWIKPYYLDRGTRVHYYCTLWAGGWIDWWEIADDCFEFVKQFARICKELGLTYITSEQSCYDPEYDICGTFDLIMGWNGKRVLVELKTSKFEMYHGLQLASYERMVEVDTVMGIGLKKGHIWVPAEDWEKNHEVLADIHSGRFDYDTWKSDKKRRRMVLLKEG